MKWKLLFRDIGVIESRSCPCRLRMLSSAMDSAENVLIELTLQNSDGSSVKIETEPGSTAQEILEHEALKLPAGFCSRLVTETAEALEPHSQIWEPQARFWLNELRSKLFKGGYIEDYIGEFTGVIKGDVRSLD